MNLQKENYSIQKKLTAVTVVLFVVKITAWAVTGSIAILTDALEYTINLISAFVGLYSLNLSTKPRDENHPYGHGKVEFLSAAVEGTLMVASGFFIIYGAVHNLKDPVKISKLDYGIFLVAITAVVNYIVGAYAAKKGKQNDSLSLLATGKHMQTDTYATIGIIIGLVLIFITGQYWLDSVVAILFALIIMVSGYKILRSSIAGIMDEADDELLKKLVALLQSSRRQNWIDLHNLRIIKYGGTLHLDCHLTVPWYLNVHDAHKEIDELARLVRINFGESVELFVHTDGCLTFSCPICTKEDCQVRQHDFVKQIPWTVDNISSNNKHKLN
ncbi:MAG: cation transporter [Bacteroidia bacterium]|nr:cation transporter [Bacteroidia bacterium]